MPRGLAEYRLGLIRQIPVLIIQEKQAEVIPIDIVGVLDYTGSTGMHAVKEQVMVQERMFIRKIVTMVGADH